MTKLTLALPEDFTLHFVEETSSTNDLAKDLANEGAPHGTLVWCLRQTAGRGRRGRSWLAGEGNLYCSLLLRPRVPVADAARLSFLAGIAAVDAVSEVTGGLVQARCKWPNDLLLNGQKLAGILLEAVGHPEPDWVIIGTGINLATVPEDLEPRPASLHNAGATVAATDMLAAYAGQLAIWLQLWDREGFAPIRDAWIARAAGIGEQVTARLGDGSELIGLFEGLDADGALLLKRNTGDIIPVTAGDVFLKGQS